MNENAVATLLFLFTAALVGGDLVADAFEGTTALHLGAEGLGACTAIVGAAWFGRRLVAARARIAASADAWRDEARRWREEAAEALAGLGAAIDRQFERWSLTPAEREVALLLLKGLSMHEVAAVRATSERTAREQARVVYRKAGVAGRAELSAFFLEDLLSS